MFAVINKKTKKIDFFIEKETNSNNYFSINIGEYDDTKDYFYSEQENKISSKAKEEFKENYEPEKTQKEIINIKKELEIIKNEFSIFKEKVQFKENI